MRIYKTIYDDNDISEIYMGYRTVVNENKEEKNVVCIVVRGTNGTLKEWSSNFDVGSVINGSDITGWNNTENHRGFDVTTNRILRFVDRYVETNLKDKENICYWITGHSRGAGISNLLSAKLIDKGNDVRGYTFAAPATTTSNEVSNAKYNSIFNIINEDDFVPQLPPSAWEFKLYGKKAVQSIDELYEEEWEKLTNCKTSIGSLIPTPIVDYNNDQFGLEHTINTIADIADDRDECYEYVEATDGAAVIEFDNYAEAVSMEKALVEGYPKFLEGTYKIEIIEEKDVEWDGIVEKEKYVLNIYHKPIFLFKLLVGVMAEDSGMSTAKFVMTDVAGYLESAKLAVISSNLGGMKHPHYTESYYLLSVHISEGDFN